MAVTGVPEEQPDHARRMVKFARAILLKMRVKRMELAEQLGDDTLALDLRIGRFEFLSRKRAWPSTWQTEVSGQRASRTWF